MATQTGATHSLECRLDSSHDLAALLAALQLRGKDEKDQRIHCEATSRGLKFVAQSAGKDVAVLGWIFEKAFREYKFSGGEDAQINLRLPIAPLVSCLTIFSEKSAMTMRYPSPSGSSTDLHFTLEEDGAVTEFRIKTLFMEDAPQHITLFSPEDQVRNKSEFRPVQPEAWGHALSEFEGLEAPDVKLQLTLRNPPVPLSAIHTQSAPSLKARNTAVVLRAQTMSSDAEVEIPREAFDNFSLSPLADTIGEVSHTYLLSSVLGSSLRAAKDSKAVKLRINDIGVMSAQFILRSRQTQLDQLYCESLVCPLATGPPGIDPRRDWSPGKAVATGSMAGYTQGVGADSTTF